MTLKAELAVRLESEPADHSAAIPHDIEGIFFNGVRGIITRGKFAVIISYIYIYISQWNYWHLRFSSHAIISEPRVEKWCGGQLMGEGQDLHKELCRKASCVVSP